MPLPRRTIGKFAKYASAACAGLYLVYVVGAAIFLNTPLFHRLAGMNDPRLTQITFHVAVSPFPGLLYAREIEIAVRDANVESSIRVRRVRAYFSPRRFFERQAKVTDLRGRAVTAFFHLKTPAEKAEHRARYGDAEGVRDLSPDAEAKMRRDRFRIVVSKVELPNVEEIRIDRDRLRGKIRIDGKFTLQPGTLAEIGPARMEIVDGAWNDDLRGVALTAKVHFHPFAVPRTAGSAVFGYLDADLDGKARAENLRLLDLTLRSLGDYGFGPTSGDVTANVRIRAGRLLPGSHFRADRTAIHFVSPKLRLEGRGKLSWEVPADRDYSVLHAEVARSKAEFRLSENGLRMNGKADAVVGDVEILGLFLPNAFSGVRGSLRMRGGEFDGVTRGPDPWRFRARVAGELSVIAGDAPKLRDSPPPTRFRVDLLDSSARFRALGKIRGRGVLAFAVYPIDFRAARAEFPDVNLDYRAEIDGKYPFAVKIRNQGLRRTFEAESEGGDVWAGRTKIGIDGFGEILRYLSDTDRLPGIAKTVLTARHLDADLEWQLSDDSIWARANAVDTDGAWKAWGTYAQDAKSPGLGVFEGKVAGMPVGFGIVDGDLRFRLFPTTAWYDGLKKELPVATSASSRRPTPTDR